MPEVVAVPLASLLLDQDNARLGDSQPSQPATQIALARLLGKKLVNLAGHIVQHGLNPAEFPIIVGTGDSKKRYKVLEGNRRTLAVKALETPTIVKGGLKDADYSKLLGLSGKFKADPIEEVTCVYFRDDEAEAANEWVRLRHTGANEGRGLEGWDSDEQDRYNVRHGRQRTKAGQVTDFMDHVDGAPADKVKITTTLDRLMGDPAVREALGIELRQGELLSWYPQDEVAKGFRRVLNDLRSQEIKVHNVYTRELREKYINGFKRTQLPTRKTKLSAPVKLEDMAKGNSTPAPVPPNPKRNPAKPKPARTAVAPRDANLNVGTPRINDIYNELLTLDANSFPNAASVTLRVFLELSTDEYLDVKVVMAEATRRNKPLAGRLKAAAEHMAKTGLIDNALKSMVYKVADTSGLLAAGTTTFNQYVHNKYVMPKPSELRLAWDEIQPFLQKIWP